MNSIAKKYLHSQKGKLCEELKKAYLAGQNIVYVICKDYDVVCDTLKSDPIFFLMDRPISRKGSVNVSTHGTTTCENVTTQPANLKFGLDNLKQINPPVPTLYVVTLRKDPTYIGRLNEALANFTNSLSGLPQAGAYAAQSMVVVVTPSATEIPMEIEQYCRVVRVAEPNADEIRDRIKELVLRHDNIDLNLQPGQAAYLDRLLNLTKGLTLNKISQIFSRIKSELDHVYVSVNDEERFAEIEKIMREEKAKLIENSAILKLVGTPRSLGKITGMAKLNAWLADRKKIIENQEQALASGFIPAPKGILLSGIPGTGKSLAAKTTAAVFGNLPLLQLDMGSILDKYQGESEHKMEEALKLAEAMSPCVLWIDEIEKGIAGSDSSSNSDSMKRIFGKMLTWMQEKESRGVTCFVFATANDISSIPPELFRSGRFDEKFYTFLPSADECAEIYLAQISSQNSKYRKFCAANSLPVRDLFDAAIMTPKFFKQIITGPTVLRSRLEPADKKLPKENKFMTGSDIEAIIERAKLILFNSSRIAKEGAVYDTDDFKSALASAIDETRTYGQTNAKSIVECFAKMSEYNFVPVAGTPSVPFDLFDFNSPDGSEPLNPDSPEVKRHLDCELRNDYDRQLFCYMAIAANIYLNPKNQSPANR